MSIVIWQGMNSTPMSLGGLEELLRARDAVLPGSLRIIQGPMPRKFIFESFRWSMPGRCMSAEHLLHPVVAVIRTPSLTNDWRPQNVMKTLVGPRSPRP